MFALGLGSIPMCLTLFKYRITPRWIAILGIVGYGLLAFGFLMKLMDLQWSMYYIPLAGLWEITFGVWLITRKKVNQPIGPNYVKKLNGNVTIHIY